MPDFDTLPLVLAGPIVRRVEPTAVSVWVALSASRTVELGVWVGPTAAPAGFFGNGSADHTASAPSLRLGEKLHLALVTLDLSGSPLIPGQIYSYNLAFTGAAAAADLSSEELLRDEGPAEEPVRLALGYLPGQLPSFALPPIELDRLRMVHGSCRKAHGHGPDGLAPLDKMIERTRDDPFARPHQLFLTGDQVYADDVAMALLPQLTVAGNALLGATEKVPLQTSTGTSTVEVTAANFPTTWRQELMTRQARFTSGAASSHVMSFGETCALYLFAWSNVLWDDLAGEADIFPETGDEDTIVAGLPAHLRDLYPPESRKQRVGKRNGLKGGYDQQKEDLKAFRKTLPNVQRALANVPTYMIFDDHEVTDDWYLTLDWRDKVLTSALGVTILRNTLLAFTLFQAWGNIPQRYGSGDHAQLLTLAPQLFGGTQFPDPAIANQLDALFGFDGSVPRLRWDFTVPTGPTQTVVLDTRTRRSFVGRYNPPGLLSQAALDEQFPATLEPSPGAEVLFVVSPAPVLGLALIEELAQPLASRGKADFIGSVVMEGEPAITGYLEWDLEAWALDAARFEAFLARCNQMKKVVILSGDVHYAHSNEMDYWRQGQPQPSRVVQLTASALKNDWGESAKRALETVAVQKLAHSAFYPASRLGWSDPGDLLGNVSVPGGAIPRQLRALLRRTPTVIPTEGWPAGTTISVPSEWAWRMSLLEDPRPDDTSPDARPSDGQIGPISPDVNPSAPDDGYVAVLQRGEKQLKTKIARAVVFASNLGLVTFGGTVTDRSVRHALMYVHPAGKKPADPQAYSTHDAGLVPTTDPPPMIS